MSMQFKLYNSELAIFHQNSDKNCTCQFKTKVLSTVGRIYLDRVHFLVIILFLILYTETTVLFFLNLAN